MVFESSIKNRSLIQVEFFILLLFFLLSTFQARATLIEDLKKINLPAGFHISVYSDQVPDARSMAMSPGGTLFVGTRTAGDVYALTPGNAGETPRVQIIARKLKMPNGVAFRNGSLYVAEVNRILRFDQIEQNLAHPLKPVVVSSDFPSDMHHGWKYISFGPDGKLYVPIGAPCNVCLKDEDKYATIMRMDPDGKNLVPFAKGIRNSVGFDWDPETGHLWFTDNGRDLMGDDVPPDELNEASTSGLHFGFPFCHGGDIPDPEFGKTKGCVPGFEKPRVRFQAHVASLGMKFYRGNTFPGYKGKIFVAEHGSWNRTLPIGYRIELYSPQKAKVTNGSDGATSIFAEGWLQGTKVLGRPVDILELKGGSLLVSDDFRGAIYNITYTKP